MTSKTEEELRKTSYELRLLEQTAETLQSRLNMINAVLTELTVSNMTLTSLEKEKENYIPLVACAHEIAQAAARLAEEAREIEKYGDTVVRRPHGKDGRPKVKDRLMLPPVSDEEAYQKWLKS